MQRPARPRFRRSVRILAVALAFVLLLPACGGGGAAGGVVVQLVTPPGPSPTPTLPPGVTPTPAVPPELVLSTIEVYQAGAVLVSVTGDVAGGQATFLGRSYPLTRGAQSQYAFVPVAMDAPPGQYPLHVDVRLPNGTRGKLEGTLSVLATEWTVDALEFTGEQAPELLDPAVEAAEQGMLASLYTKVTPEKLWDGPWLQPADGALTARFGEQRTVNGAETAEQHGGTDIGNAEGTPVVAANAGRVVFAGPLTVHGNMVVIDHGGGVYSGYAHLSTIDVAVGQSVPSGGQVGAIGNTGRSTGAHLHWEMAAHGVLLDALRFVDGSNGF